MSEEKSTSTEMPNGNSDAISLKPEASTGEDVLFGGIGDDKEPSTEKSPDEKDKGSSASPESKDAEDSSKDSDEAIAKLIPDAEVPDKPFEGDVGGYKLKLMPGLKADNPELQDFIKVLKTSEVKQEKAQGMLDMFIENRKKAIQNAFEMDRQYREKLNDKWINELKSDPEFGRDNYTASCNYVQMALRKFIPKNELIGDPNNKDKLSFLDMVIGANIKNAPPFAKFLRAVGKYIQEAQPVTSYASSPTNKAATYEDALFGSLKENGDN